MNRGQRYMLLMNARHELRAAQRTVERLAEQLRDTDCAAPLLAAAFSVGGAAQQLDVLSGLAPRRPAHMPRTTPAAGISAEALDARMGWPAGTARKEA